jgi:hypothetical protein
VRQPNAIAGFYDDVMVRRAWSVVVACVAVVIINGCGDDSMSSQTVAPADTALAPTTTSTALAVSPLTIVAGTEETTVASSPEIDPALRTLVDQAVADLATRLKIDASSIVTVSAQAMSWSDGSLGCPQPGMLYTQAMVDGAMIELSVDGTSYSYHSGASGAPFLCQKT